MINSDIHRYERELVKNIHSLRQKKAVRTAFRRHLPTLLEEDPNPSYETLSDAFGPPAQLALSLLEESPVPPLSKGKKALLVVVPLVVLAVLVGSLCVFWNTSDQVVVLSAPPEGFSLRDGSFFMVDDPLVYSDIPWKQAREYPSYVVEVHNTGRAPVLAALYTRDGQEPFLATVPTEETRYLLVRQARPSTHILAFDTSDGDLSGTVRVLVSSAPLTQFDPSSVVQEDAA